MTGSRGYFDDDMSSISPLTNGTTNNLVDLPPELVLAAPKVQPGDFAPNVVEEAASEHALQYAMASRKEIVAAGTSGNCVTAHGQAPPETRNRIGEQYATKRIVCNTPHAI
jgi:hypothetical protein